MAKIEILNNVDHKDLRVIINPLRRIWGQCVVHADVSS